MIEGDTSGEALGDVVQLDSRRRNDATKDLRPELLSFLRDNPRQPTGPDDFAGSDDELSPIVERNERRSLWRVVLGLLSVTIAAVSLPLLVAANPWNHLLGAASTEHLTRDGALGLVVSTAAGLVAWRPRWAAAMTWCCVVVVAIQLLGGIHDGHHDGVTFRFEAIHGAALVVTGLIAFGAQYRQYVPAGSRFNRR